ncbi:MAG: arylsulfatase [Planctomycetota bacterium]
MLRSASPPEDGRAARGVGARVLRPRGRDAPPPGRARPDAPGRPNVILVLTDDQGYGDVGYNGNKITRTPNLDRFAREGVEFSRFYASPCCTPTRAALMTGRQSFRLNVTWVGQPLHPDELAMSEAFKAAGYATGCFGKWGNLGTHYPLRAIDRGFDRVVVHLKGQFSPPHNKTCYFDPILQVDGEERQLKGYCNDIWFDEAEAFIERSLGRPFFVYLATNLPHLPAQVPTEYSDPYKDKLCHDQAERVAGMVTHIDKRFGRLLAKLDALGVRDDTIVIFLSDNGGVWTRDLVYTAGLRGKKGTIYEGGIRVPCVMDWPGRFVAGRKIDRIAAHVDIMPTLLEATGVKPEREVEFDGVSLMPLLTGSVAQADWPDRTLVMQGYPTGTPQRRRCYMVQNQRYKLVQPIGNKHSGHPSAKPIPEDVFRYALYDIEADRGENNDIAARHPEIVAKMKAEYEAWFDDVSTDPGFTRKRPVMQVGAPQQTKTRFQTYGGMVIDVRHEGDYRITVEPFGKVKWAPGDRWVGGPFVAKAPGRATFRRADTRVSSDVQAGATKCVFERVPLKAGVKGFQVDFTVAGKKVYGGRDADNDVQGPLHVTFERLD